MFKLNILLLIFFFSFYLPCYSQESVHAELEVNIAPKSKNDSLTSYRLKTMVREIVSFKNYSKDSVELRIESMHLPFPKFFYQEVRISVSGKGQEIVNVPYVFEYDTFKFVIPAPNCRVVLDYQFQSDFLHMTGFETVAYLVSYIYDWASWYLTCEGMKVDRIRFNVPDNQYFFANLPTVRDGTSIDLDPERIKDNNISFYLLAKEFYDFTKFKYKDVAVELYQAKGPVPRFDLGKFVPGVNNPSLLKERKHLVKRAVRSVMNLLDFDYPMKISVADKRLAQREKVIWGSTVYVSDREAFVLIDSTMWYNDDLYHELIHAFSQDILDLPESDSTYYFFSESIVDYLAMYLKYTDGKERDRIFDKMILTYAASKELNSSIFTIKGNNLNGNNNTGSSYVINQKTPFVIHSFAKQIGEKRFIQIFKNFYRQAKVKGRVSMADFESVAKRHGVTDEEWKWFMKYL